MSEPVPPFERVFDAWHKWFFERWRRGEATFPGGCAIESYILRGEYNGFGGEW